MFRTLAFASALAAAALSTHTLAAQNSSSKPVTPAMSHASTAKIDTGKAATGARAAAPTPARHAAWTKAQVKEAQQGLAKAGLYKGAVSGVMNKDTQKALRAYQKQNKMPVTGRLSDSVLVKLKSA